MSTPKKPGTDLAALKARLAKKTADAGSPPPPPSEPLAESLPPPVADAAPSHATPPAAPSYEAPSYSAPPAPTPSFEAFSAAAPTAAPAVDDPFGGEGGFDPSAGLIDSGEIKSRGNLGVAAFFGVLAFAFGAGVGYLGHGIVGKSSQVEAARTKGAKIHESAKAISESRKAVSLALEGLVAKAQTDPSAAAADIEALLKDKFDTQERIDGLFGWQLGSLSADGVRATFKLFEEATRLKTDLGYLGAFLSANAEALKTETPLAFAVAFNRGTARLVVANEPLCGEIDKPDTLQTCSPSEAVAFRVQHAIGADPTVLPKGTDDGEGVLLGAEGGVFAIAVGLEPHRNAAVTRDRLFLQLNERLETTAKAEKIALEKLEKYVDSPNVDGPQD